MKTGRWLLGPDSSTSDDALKAALHLATAYTSTECVGNLLVYGADPFTSQRAGPTPFANAVRLKHLGIVRLFLEDAKEQRLLIETEFSCTMHSASGPKRPIKMMSV